MVNCDYRQLKMAVLGWVGEESQVGKGMGQGEGVKIVEHICEVEDDRYRPQQWLIATIDNSRWQYLVGWGKSLGWGRVWDRGRG